MPVSYLKPQERKNIGLSPQKPLVSYLRPSEKVSVGLPPKPQPPKPQPNVSYLRPQERQGVGLPTIPKTAEEYARGLGFGEQVIGEYRGPALPEVSITERITKAEDSFQSYWRNQQFEKLYKKEVLKTPEVAKDYKEPTGPIGQFVESFKRGVRTHIKAGSGYFLEAFGRELGNTKLMNFGMQLGDKATIELLKRPELQPPDDIKPFFKGGVVDPRYYGVLMGETMPFMLGTIGTALLGGLVAGPVGAGIGAYGSVYALERGNSYKDMIDRGIAVDKANYASGIYGTISAVIENAFGIAPAKIGAKVFAKPIQKTATKSFKSFLLKELPKTALRTLRRSAEEGGEEVAQQLTQGIINKWLKVDGAKLSEGLAESFAGGFIASLPFGAVDILQRAPKIPAGLSIQEVKAIPKELEPLAQEAKRYPSAKEFVKSQQKVFRGGEVLDIKQIGDRGLPITTDKKIAETFLKGKEDFRKGLPFLELPTIGLEESYISSLAKIATRKDIPNDIFNAYKAANPVMKPEIAEPIIGKWAKANGFDAVDYRTLGKTSAKEAEIKVLNPDILKTKSQLTDFYNQAVKDVEPKVSAEKIVKEAEITPEKQIKAFIEPEKPTKITRPEPVLLRERLRAEARGAKIAGKVERGVAKRQVAVEKRQKAREIRKTARVVREKILTTIKEKTATVKQIKQDVVELAKTLDLNERGKLLATIKNVSTLKDLGKAKGFIERLEEESVERKLRKQIQTELKTIKVRMVGGKPVGKFTPETQKLLDGARNLTKLSIVKAEEKLNNNLKQFEDSAPPVDIVLENWILSRFTGSGEDLGGLLNFVSKTKERGATGFALKQFNAQEELSRKRNLVLDRIRSDKGITKGRETFGPVKHTIRYKIVSSLKTLGKRWIADWQGLMGILDWNSSVEDKVLAKTFGTLKEDNSYKQLTTEFTDDIMKAITDSYGVKPKKHLIQKKIIELNKPIDLGVFKNNVGVKGQLILSKFEIIKRWMEFKDTTLTQSFEVGNNYTEEIKNAINGMMTARDKSYAAKEFVMYREQWKKINPIYSEINGVDLPFNEFYSPIRREGYKQKDDSFGEFMNEALHRQALTSNSFKTRVKNALPIKQMSSIEVLERHIKETNYYIAYAKKIREFNSIFHDEKIKETIKQEFSQDLNKALDNNIRDLTTNGNRSARRYKPIDFFRKNFTVGALMAKPVIGIKQLVSTVAYLEKIGPVDLSVGIADFWKHPLKNYKTLQKESVFIRTRGAHMERDIKAAMKSDIVKSFSKRKNFINTMMVNVKLGDKGAIILGSWAMRRSGIKRGADLQSIIAEYEDFSASTQQSADISRLSEIQRGGSLEQLFTMFKSSPRQYLQKELNAVKTLFQKDGFTPRNIKKVARVLAIYHVLIPVIFQLVANLGGWDEEDRKEYLRAGILGSLNGLFIFGDITESILRKVLGLRVWDNELPIYEIANDVNKAIQKLDFEDIRLDDVLDSLKELTSAGNTFGVPVDQTKNIFTGFGNIIEGNFKNGISEILGWSPYVVEGKKKATKTGVGVNPFDTATRGGKNPFD